jgi:hypothetical protein
MAALEAAGAPQVWIDMACLDMTDTDWLLSLSGVPIAVIGYGDSLYAFAEWLSFPIEMPAGMATDPDEPGFCVWLQTADKHGEVTGQSMRSFDELTAEAVLAACGQMGPA